MKKFAAILLAIIALASIARAQTPPLFAVNSKYSGFAGTGGGTANAQTVTYSPATTALTNGQIVSWVPSNANTGAATLAVDAIAAHSIVKINGSAILANDLITTSIAFVMWDGTNFELLDPQSAVGTRRVCDISIGDTSGSAITNGQLGPQKRICYIPSASTVKEMDVAADGGTPNVIVGVNHAGTTSNIVSAALATASSGGIACSNTGGTTGIDGATTCTNTLQNTSMSAGDYLELVSGTAGGTAKLMTIHVIYTVN